MINVLEFLAAAITIQQTITQAQGRQRILAFTDSSSALGWLFKASFDSDQPVQDAIARWLATRMIKSDSSLYSQHIKGTHNFIADSLSRDHHMNSPSLIHSLYSLLPAQTPKNFRISTLPPETISWISLLSQLATKRPPSPPSPTRSKLGALTDGGDILAEWESKMSGWKDIIENNKTISCPHLHALAEEISTVKQAKQYSKDTLSKPPLEMYVRPFGRIFGQTQL